MMEAVSHIRNAARFNSPNAAVLPNPSAPPGHSGPPFEAAVSPCGLGSDEVAP